MESSETSEMLATSALIISTSLVICLWFAVVVGAYLNNTKDTKDISISNQHSASETSKIVAIPLKNDTNVSIPIFHDKSIKVRVHWNIPLIILS